MHVMYIQLMGDLACIMLHISEACIVCNKLVIRLMEIPQVSSKNFLKRWVQNTHENANFDVSC